MSARRRLQVASATAVTLYLVVSGALLIHNCATAPKRSTPRVGGASAPPRAASFSPIDAAPGAVSFLLFDLAPGMYAAHRDTVDSTTYLDATPRPVSHAVALFVTPGVTVAIYKTPVCTIACP